MKSTLPKHHTKIVCTLGPASDSPRILESLIRHGMTVARLNLSHGTPDWHRTVSGRIREISGKMGRRVAILADLPGPKIRIGSLLAPMTLRRDESLLLSGERAETGKERWIPLELPPLRRPLAPGDRIYLSDGAIALRVDHSTPELLRCRVITGGILLSRKGVNIPGLLLNGGAFTDEDRRLLAIALEAGADGVGVSFVETGEDLDSVRREARRLGHDPFLVAKIERRRALENIDVLLERADALMVARGDLGVEVPIERIALLQKALVRKAIDRGKPVIIATQMLESMVHNPRPTRAEVTDVANAVIDGADALMLSEETAMGENPVAAVAMLARIIGVTESAPHPGAPNPRIHPAPSIEEVLASGVRTAAEQLSPRVIAVPTETGATATRIARFRLRAWILALSPSERTCQKLCLCRGVHPQRVERQKGDWKDVLRGILARLEIRPGIVLLTQGPGPETPGETNRLEILRYEGPEAALAPGEPNESTRGG